MRYVAPSNTLNLCWLLPQHTGRIRNDTEGVNRLCVKIHQQPLSHKHMPSLSFFFIHTHSFSPYLVEEELRHNEACTPCPAYLAICLKVSRMEWQHSALTGKFNSIFSASVMENKKKKGDDDSALAAGEQAADWCAATITAITAIAAIATIKSGAWEWERQQKTSL